MAMRLREGSNTRLCGGDLAGLTGQACLHSRHTFLLALCQMNFSQTSFTVAHLDGRVSPCSRLKIFLYGNEGTWMASADITEEGSYAIFGRNVPPLEACNVSAAGIRPWVLLLMIASPSQLMPMCTVLSWTQERPSMTGFFFPAIYLMAHPNSTMDEKCTAVGQTTHCWVF